MYKIATVMNNLLVLAMGFLIGFYQFVVSPILGPRCRYLPTCSEYAKEAISLHGAWRGGVLALKRIGKCHPWGGTGYDPVPVVDPSTHKDT